MQLQSALTLLAVYASIAIASPIANPATDEASVALASVQRFNGYDGPHCGGAATAVVKIAPDVNVPGSTCFSFDAPMYGFIANEPRCTYERFIAHDCSGLNPLTLSGSIQDCTTTIRGPWSVRQTCDAAAAQVWY